MLTCDCVQALTPLTLGISSVKASLLGAWWGFGHCIGQLILGLLMLLLKARLLCYSGLVVILENPDKII